VCGDTDGQAGSGRPERLLAGRYRMEERLGQGGMGVVRAGWDVEQDVRVAIKVLPPQRGRDAATTQRFLHEADILTRESLEHPAIVRVLDSGHDAGSLFLVMEYLEGDSLAAELPGLDRDCAWLPAMLERLRPVFEALDLVHAAGVIHRDLKPENVVFRRDGSPVLIDFGVALAETLPRLTGVGSTFGSPPYMSPEQALGEKLTGASDQYALAVVLYELIGGTPPFIYANAIRTLESHVRKPPPRLSDQNSAVPDGVAEAVHRALNKDPRDRYPSCLALHAALGQALRAPPRFVCTAGYRLVQRLGQGRLGIVHEALDEAHERRVVVEILAPEERARPALAKHFDEEAALLAELDHPALPEVYEHSTEGHCLVREYVEGVPVDRRFGKLGDDPDALADLLCFLEPLFDLLDRLHGVGLVHRDLEPRHILVREDGRPAVVGFGLAEDPTAVRLAGQGPPYGVPYYLSPEQAVWAAGDAGGEVTGASDQYSLAVVLYELLTGLVPFRGEPRQVLHQHLVATPARVTDHNPALPTEVSDAVHQALAKNPEDRFPSCLAFHDALQSPETECRRATWWQRALGRLGG